MCGVNNYFCYLFGLKLQLIFLLAFVTNTLQASSTTSLNATFQDTAQIHRLLDKAEDLKYKDVNRADSLAREAIRMSENDSYLFGVAKGEMVLGSLTRERGNFKDAMQLFNHADSLFSKIGERRERAYLLNEISILFANTGEIEKSRTYFQEALDIFEELGDVAGQGQMSHNIAITYDLGGNLDSAMVYYFRGYRLKKAAGDSNGVGTSLNNLGIVSLNMGRIDSALFYTEKAYQLFKQLGNKRGMMTTLNQIGKIYEGEGEPQKAIPYYQESFELAQELDNLENLVTKSEDLMNAYRGAGMYEEALTYYDLYHELDDSLKTQQFDASVAEQKLEFELLRKNAEVEALKEQQILEARNRYLLLVGLIMVGVFALVFYRERLRLRRLNKTLREKSKEIESHSIELNEHNRELQRLNEIKTQLFTILSHDMRDPLHTMRGFMELMKEGEIEKEEMISISTTAYEEIGRTSDMLTNLLLWADSQIEDSSYVEEFVNLREVTKEVYDLYIHTANQKGIDFRCKIDSDIRVLSERASVHLMVRNLIGNAIKFTPQGEQVRVLIDEITPSKVTLAVSDDGVGMSQKTLDSLLVEKKKTSRGTNNERGTGIGLFITNEVAKKVNVGIRVESELGKGSTFYLDFKRAFGGVF